MIRDVQKTFSILLIQRQKLVLYTLVQRISNTTFRNDKFVSWGLLANKKNIQLKDVQNIHALIAPWLFLTIHHCYKFADIITPMKVPDRNDIILIFNINNISLTFVVTQTSPLTSHSSEQVSTEHILIFYIES